MDGKYADVATVYHAPVNNPSFVSFPRIGIPDVNIRQSELDEGVKFLMDLGLPLTGESEQVASGKHKSFKRRR